MIDDQKQKALDSAKVALKDCRSIGALLQISENKVRIDKAGNEYPRYLDINDTPILTVDDILPHITMDNVEFSYPKVKEERFANSLMGCRIKLKNVFLMVTKEYGDENLVFYWGVGYHNLTLVMTPFQDNDKEIPLKIAYIDFEQTDVKDKLIKRPGYLTETPVEQIKKPRYPV